MNVRLAVFTEPQQGASYSQLLAVAQHAEQLGYDGFFRSDHYLAMSGDGLPGPTDAWTTLAALAVQTMTIRLGTLVTSATFRLPGPLAITVAQVDEMSNGRVELGLGSGWFDDEHHAYGIPFPSLGERFDRLTEQLEIVTGLWTTPPGETFDFDGQHYQLATSPALPKPQQSPHPPIIIGGVGRKRTPELAAGFASEFNVPFCTLDESRDAFDRVRESCQLIGRDPVPFSVAQTIACGRSDAETDRRADAIGRRPPLCGSPAQVVDQIGAFAQLGVERLFLQILDLSDLDHLDVIMSEVASQLG